METSPNTTAPHHHNRNRERVDDLYKPTIEDVRWAYAMLIAIGEGGVLQYWSVPLTYRVSHRNQTISLLTPELLRTPTGMTKHLQNKAAFREAGYTMLETESDVSTATKSFEAHTNGCTECSRNQAILCPIGEDLLQEFHQTLVDAANAQRRPN